MNILSIISLLRPQQWVKNIFIFLPLFFSGQITNCNLLINCIIVFISFCFAASSIYCFNDIYDVEVDKLHPKKSFRLIASGKISKINAHLIQFICLFISLGMIVLFYNRINFKPIFLTLLLYYVLNICYSIRLKHYVIIDILIIAFGFVLRVAIGGFATSVQLSEWLVIMTFLLSLFLALVKRREEVVFYERTTIITRENIGQYNIRFINQIITITASITLIAYIMYTISPEVENRFDSHNIYMTSIFVFAGVIRYLQQIMVKEKDSDPFEFILHDYFIQFCIFTWIVSFILIIYL